MWALSGQSIVLSVHAEVYGILGLEIKSRFIHWNADTHLAGGLRHKNPLSFFGTSVYSI